METPTKNFRHVTFSVSAPVGSEVFIGGSFNHWKSDVHRLKDVYHSGHYMIELMLLPGEYEYKFVVNGEWRVDVECPHWVRNKHGTLNSVIRVE
jgi:1,4-alpha-glucan branching enzyme